VPQQYQGDRMISNPEDFGLSVKVETIGADKANEYLNNNAKHREIKQERVNRYILDLAKGDWQLNGKVIIFDADGVLRNGQHRLTAVAQSDIAITTLVVRGVPVQAFDKDN